MICLELVDINILYALCICFVPVTLFATYTKQWSFLDGSQYEIDNRFYTALKASGLLTVQEEGPGHIRRIYRVGHTSLVRFQSHD